MPKVRTTINPTQELDVSEREYRSLLADGLILKTTATTVDGLIRAGEAASEKRESPTAINFREPGEPDPLTTVDDNDENFNDGPVNEPGDGDADDESATDDDKNKEV